ncbi:MAG: amidohydrolase [Fimbriimonadales bacterium]|nr:amidohydrolase [Fimbriimonadales bacterium]
MRIVYRNARDPFDGSLRDVCVQDGRIVRGPVRDSQVVDLRGAELRPKFVDAHAHVLPMGLDLVRPSVAGCATRSEVLDRIRDGLRGLARGEWLIVSGYDPDRHRGEPTLLAADLDRLSAETPIVLRHASGHGSVVNSAVLRLAGFTEQTPDPPGGSIVRGRDGRPNGWLLERANEMLRKHAPKEDVSTMAEAILRACERIASMGIGTVSDMMTGYYDLNRELQAYKEASQRGCPVRLRLYVQWSSAFGPRSRPDWIETLSGADPHRCRVAGIKVFADGALGARTAAIRGAYEGQDAPSRGWSGILTYRPSRLREMVRRASEEGWSVAIHAIGDHALDVALRAVRDSGVPSRHRIEHAMLADDRQIEQLAELGCFVCAQPEFLADFSSAYRESLGLERMARLNPLGSMDRAGVRLCFGTDRPICLGEPWTCVRLAARRPEGFDPNEAVSESLAYRCFTELSAQALGDRDLGHLRPGAWADLLPVEAAV